MRRLVPVYFVGVSNVEGLNYLKALVYKEDVDLFLAMGATLDPIDIDVPEIYKIPEVPPEEVKTLIKEPEPVKQKEEVTKDVDSPDTGDGVPGSFKWHKTQLAAIKGSKQIVNYVTSVIGRDAEPDIDRRKSLAVIRLRAQKLIKEFLENANESK